MPLPAPDFPADHLPPSRTAFFLDFDGTLAQIVADPDRAAVGAETLAVLRRLE
ncbi:MAG: trehalose-phosphatase, partial [Bauldia sp.]